MTRHEHIEIIVKALLVEQQYGDLSQESLRSALTTAYRNGLLAAVEECERGAGMGPAARLALQQAAVRITRLGR